MNVSAVQNQIKSNTMKSFYIFTGEELEVQWIYIRQIAKHKKQEIRYADSVLDVYNALKKRSFINKSYCYILRDDKELISSDKLCGELSELKQDTVILLLTSVDKRTKFYKNYKDIIVEFEFLSEQLLVKYIQKEIPLSVKNCQKLIEVCESSYGRILLEIDKIKQYTKYLGPAPMYDGVFEKLLQDGTIYQPPKDAIFDFVDAVLRRQPGRAFGLLRQSYAIGEATMVLLSVLYTNVKQVLQVQSCDSGDIEKSTGLTAWQVKCAKEKIGKWRIGELVNLLKDIQETERSIKIGAIEDSIAVEYILVRNL